MKLSRFLAAFALVCFTTLAFAALPTVDMVQAEVQRGNYAQAEQMMQEVVTAKPGSARAHYIYAEILAHNKRFEQAALQASLARQADPAIKFADAAKFSAFESLLDREQRAAAAPRANAVQPSVVPAMQAPRQVARPAPEPQSSGIPSWIWVVGLCAIGYFAWRMLQNSRRQTMMAAPMGGAMVPAQGGGMAPMGGGGYGPGGPGYGQAPSAGSGLMGVGLGVAGGVAAGMLAEKLLHGGDHGNSNAGSNYGQSNPAGGGGFFDDAAPANYNPAAQELEQRPVDFGGGDGWGGGGDAGGGGSSGGDGGGGGDGGW